MIFMFSQKGQYFAPYRLVLGAAIGSMILLIILGVVSYFESLKETLTYETIVSGIKSAVASPNGMVVKKPNVFIKSSTFSKRFFAEVAGVEEECIILQAPDSGVVHLIENAIQAIVVEKGVAINLYFKCCMQTNGDEDCEMECWISFAEKLEGGCES